MIFRDSDHSYRLDGVVKSGRVEYGEYSEWLRDVESPYLSVTSFLKWFEPFVDWELMAKNYAKKHNMKLEKVKKLWLDKGEEGRMRGSKHHYRREEEMARGELNSVIGDYDSSRVVRVLEVDGEKEDKVLELEMGCIYVEKLLWLEDYKISGMADIIRVDDLGFVHVMDYKTDKSLEHKSWKLSNKGIPDRCYYPIKHIDYCNMNKYALQLSLYMYMVLLHNPGLKFGSLTILHERFSHNGIYTKTEPHNIPYLKHEIELLLEHRAKVLLGLEEIEIEKVKKIHYENLKKQEKKEVDKSFVPKVKKRFGK